MNISLLLLYSLLYAFIHLLPQRLCADPAALVSVLEAAFWLLLLRNVKRKGLQERLLLCRPRTFSLRLSWPLLCIPLLQLALHPELPSWRELPALAFAALGEEVLFRAVLPLAMREKLALGEGAVCFLCAALFALFHLLNGAAAALLTLLYAFCAALGFSALAEQTGSVLSPALLHLAINLTLPSSPEPSAFVVLNSALFLLAYIFKRKGKNKNETLH